MSRSVDATPDTDNVSDVVTPSDDTGPAAVIIPGCDPIPGATRIEISPTTPLAPNAFEVFAHMPQAWVNVGLTFTGPGGTLQGVQHDVVATGTEWVWDYTIPTSAPGDFCLIFTTDNGNTVRQRRAIRLTGTGVIPSLDAGSSPPPPTCACRSDVNNFCNYAPGTNGCPMTAPHGYCDPNGDGSYSDGDWTRGYNEFAAACGAGTAPDSGVTPPSSGSGLSCGNVQWWNSPTATPYMDYNPTLGHVYWWDTDIAMRTHTPVQLRHDSQLVLQGIHPWGWQPTFRDQVTGELFQFLHLQIDAADMHTTTVGMVYPAGTVVGLSGGDTGPTGLGVYSTGAHLCVQTQSAYRTVFPAGMDTCH